MHEFIKFIFVIKLYMFRTVPLYIMSFSLYTQQWYMSYRFADSLRASVQILLASLEYYSKNTFENLMFIGPCIIAIVDEWKTNLMSLAILFHFLCAQHVSNINISIIRSLRMCCWITTSVDLFSVRCVLGVWCGWFWVVLCFSLQHGHYSN